MNFWDTSAVVPCLVGQKESKVVQVIHREDPVMVVWWGGRIECISALCRERRENRLSNSDWHSAIVLLNQLWGAAFEVPPTEKVRERAERLLNVHSLRASDAVQLAAALIVVQETPQTGGFVCLDQRLRMAAEEEGFAVLP